MVSSFFHEVKTPKAKLNYKEPISPSLVYLPVTTIVVELFGAASGTASLYYTIGLDKAGRLNDKLEAEIKY